MYLKIVEVGLFSSGWLGPYNVKYRELRLVCMVAAVFIFRDFERSSNASFLGTAVKLSITKGATPLQQTLLPPRIPTSNRRAEPGVNRAQTLQNMIGARRNEWNSSKVLAINPLGTHPTATPQHLLDWSNPPTSRQGENGTSPNI
ncbi:hypothetical protein Pst134EB_010810 [Puccinia striiformis f. sp. tritici]|nr:hypothetical protein Pst134EB_010810 [Puccinia striiformis f. sp. tritici]